MVNWIFSNCFTSFYSYSVHVWIEFSLLVCYRIEFSTSCVWEGECAHTKRQQKKNKSNVDLFRSGACIWYQIAALDESAKHILFILAHLISISTLFRFFYYVYEHYIYSFSFRVSLFFCILYIFVCVSLCFCSMSLLRLFFLHVLWLSNLFVLCTLPIKQWWKTENTKYIDGFTCGRRYFFPLTFLFETRY